MLITTTRSENLAAVSAPSGVAPAGERRAPGGAATACAAGHFGTGSGFDCLETDQPGKPTRAAADGINQTATDSDIRVASQRKAAVEAYRALRSQGETTRRAARRVGVKFATLYLWDKAYGRELNFDALLPGKSTGRKPKHRFSAQEAAEVKALVLQTNWNATAGSTPEAVRAAMKRGLLDPETAAMIQARFDAGVAPLPEAMRDQVRVPELTTRASRSPRNAWLENIQSPGSLYLTRDLVTGAEREILPAEIGTLDDGTINFVACVPFTLPGNPCCEKFGVMVGRFQFILPVDHRSHFIPGFNYTARPRSSYRAEDLTATIHTIALEHGYWPTMVLEHGVSAANLVTDTLELLGVRIIRASSPHQKVVEGVFNKLWTKLSLMPGQVGRYRGEEEEVNALIGSCRRGATDPRQHFPLLKDVLHALKEAITEHNAQRINSRQYGSWVPAEFFGRHAHAMRRLDPGQAWMFSPVITDALTVRGFKVRKSVVMMEDYSEVFDFSAEWMGELNGALVKLYFNPFAPDVLATAVLAQNFKGRKAGEVLGVAEQINRMTRFRRRSLGYGEDPDIGLEATKRIAQALRRSVVAIRTDGSVGAQAHEARSGAGEIEPATTSRAGASVTLDPIGSRAGETPGPTIAAPVQRMAERARLRAAGVSEDEFERQAAKLARDEQRRLAQRAMTITVSDD